jgi:hypothetical protein
MDAGVKELIRAFVTTHISEDSIDFYAGKGRGLIILLHG